MKIVIDMDKCSAHGRCFATASAVYDTDEDGFNAMNDTEVPPGLEAQAREGATSCPERAITLVD